MSVPELLRVDYWHAEKLVSRPSRRQQKSSQLRSIVQISANRTAFAFSATICQGAP
jgi:hypothetical protein